MGRRTRTKLPISEELLKPEVKKPEIVQEQLKEFRETQKFYYDKQTKPRPEIKPNDAIRTLTPDGWKKAELVEKHELPRSYIIKAGNQGREMRRNRKELLITKEPPHRTEPTYIPQPKVQLEKPKPRERVDTQRIPIRKEEEIQRNETGNQQPQRSRFGRPLRSPNYLKDFVRYNYIHSY